MIENLEFVQCAMTGVIVVFVFFLVSFILAVLDGKR